MAIYALGSREPKIHSTAFVHPEAVVIGSVEIGAESTIWAGAVLRGDDGEIRIGQRTSIQDNSVLHTTPQTPTIVGDDCVIGHLVHLESCTIESGAQVSTGAIVLHRVIVGAGAIVGANSVVLNDTIVPAGALAVGSPAVIKVGRARREEIASGSANYVERGKLFAKELRKIRD